MVNQLLEDISKNNDKGKVVPLSILEEIQKEMNELSQKEEINGLQKWLIGKRFSYQLPRVDFEIRSIIIIAAPSPKSIVFFNYKDQRIPAVLPATYADYSKTQTRLEQFLTQFLGKNNLHYAIAEGLPRKLLSVESGLAKYGRNNICYVEGMGSYLHLFPFFSDIPCEEEAPKGNQSMEACKTCKECLKHCPTGAILPDRFLINNEKCLTHFNEVDSKHPFPEWLLSSAHNSLVGCNRCQEVCPMNVKNRDNVVERLEFSEEETQDLLSGIKEEQLSTELKQKLVDIDMLGYLGTMPRNLKVLLP